MGKGIADFNIRNIEIYCFTGTGNTLTVVEAMKEEFEKRGFSVDIKLMEKTDPSNIQTENVIIGLAFPVAMQGTFRFVWEFVEKLPNSSGTPIFMVDTMEGFSGGVVGPMRKIVEKKGYLPIGAKEIKMPANLFNEKMKDEEKEKKKKEGIEEGRRYVEELVSGRTYWGRIPLFSDIVSLLSRSQKPYRFFRRWFPILIDKNKCTLCRICERVCPVNNIKVDEEVNRGDECYYCMRCVEFCPTDAIEIKGMKRKKMNNINVSKIL